MHEISNPEKLKESYYAKTCTAGIVLMGEQEQIQKQVRKLVKHLNRKLEELVPGMDTFCLSVTLNRIFFE